MFSADNIVAKANTYSTPGLQLVVGSKVVDGMVPTAEIATLRSDFLYGSYRASIKIARSLGTCAAFYWVCAPYCTSVRAVALRRRTGLLLTGPATSRISTTR